MAAQKKKNPYGEEAIRLHKQYRGKVEIASKMPLETEEDLSIAYTPGVAEPCLAIADDKELVYDYTLKKNAVAVISDGSAVLGLGNIGPEASLPVMEGKAVLFKKFADVDAFPIVLESQDTEEIITTIKQIAPTFGGINLEDISAPRCFEIETRLKEHLKIPVMHDDQHGTAVVTLAGIINSLRITGRKFEDLSIVINGAGAAGKAILLLLREVGVRNIIMCDSKGIIYEERDSLSPVKQELAAMTNQQNRRGSLEDAVKNMDLFIGVSVPEVLTAEMVHTMNNDPIIFAMANPTPEIMPDEAISAGAKIVATGRSDFPNQVNNVLAFPGIFRGLLDARAVEITNEMYVAAAYAIADCIEDPTPENIIPSAFDEAVAPAVAKAVQICSEENC